MTRSLFGTDGVRGRANTYPMTADLALRLGAAVTAIDAAAHRLTLSDGGEVTYRKLIWSGGGDPRRLPAGSERVQWRAERAAHRRSVGERRMNLGFPEATGLALLPAPDNAQAYPPDGEDRW